MGWAPRCGCGARFRRPARKGHGFRVAGRRGSDAPIRAFFGVALAFPLAVRGGFVFKVVLLGWRSLRGSAGFLLRFFSLDLARGMFCGPRRPSRPFLPPGEGGGLLFGPLRAGFARERPRETAARPVAADLMAAAEPRPASEASTRRCAARRCLGARGASASRARARQRRTARARDTARGWLDAASARTG